MELGDNFEALITGHQENETTKIQDPLYAIITQKTIFGKGCLKITTDCLKALYYWVFTTLDPPPQWELGENSWKDWWAALKELIAARD